MGSILLALPKQADASRIAGIIRTNGTELDIHICGSASEVLREANTKEFGVVLCTPVIRGMNYLELSDCLPGTFSMIILTRNTSLEIVPGKMSILTMPLKSAALMEAIQLAVGGFVRPNHKKKKIAVQRSPLEQKIIDDAKAILIERKGMTEPEAFRYIQKNSMDSGRTLVESAQMVLLLNSDWSN